MVAGREPGSFRDSAGFVFEAHGDLFRQIDRSFGATWDQFVACGLYADLINEGVLVDAAPADLALGDEHAYAVIKPVRIPTISYPYEWSFSQLRDAALVTLQAMRKAMQRGFWLRDATAYNVQFVGTRPTLIDSLSFGVYDEGKPWPAYGQFCRHFLAPLALGSIVNAGLLRLQRGFIDGIPLDMASAMLPFSTKFNPGLATHLHLHAVAGRVKGSGASRVGRPMPRAAILGLVDSLEKSVLNLKPPDRRTTWAAYYKETNYSEAAFADKHRIVSDFLATIEPKPATVWDLGANSGEFSECAAAAGAKVVAWDADPTAVELAYLKWREERREDVLPLLQDFTNPSPSLGWACRERASLAERGPADAAMALALVHHLAIGNNVPLGMVAEWLASLSDWLIIEFVPKQDSQVQRMLATRQDIFADYTEEGFERSFGDIFVVRAKALIQGTSRTLYLMRKREVTA